MEARKIVRSITEYSAGYNKRFPNPQSLMLFAWLDLRAELFVSFPARAQLSDFPPKKKSLESFSMRALGKHF